MIAMAWPTSESLIADERPARDVNGAGRSSIYCDHCVSPWWAIVWIPMIACRWSADSSSMYAARSRSRVRRHIFIDPAPYRLVACVAHASDRPIATDTYRGSIEAVQAPVGWLRRLFRRVAACLDEESASPA